MQQVRVGRQHHNLDGQLGQKFCLCPPPNTFKHHRTTISAPAISSVPRHSARQKPECWVMSCCPFMSDWMNPVQGMKADVQGMSNCILVSICPDKPTHQLQRI